MGYGHASRCSPPRRGRGGFMVTKRAKFSEEALHEPACRGHRSLPSRNLAKAGEEVE